MENKNEKSLNEHVKKLLYRAGYTINETPKYKPLIEDESQFDTLPPEVLKSAGGMTLDGQPQPTAGGGTDAYFEGGRVPEDNADQLPGASRCSSRSVGPAVTRDRTVFFAQPVPLSDDCGEITRDVAPCSAAFTAARRCAN